MFGVAVNAAAIVVCALAGAAFARHIPARFEGALRQAAGLAIAFVGLKGAFDNENTLLLILSLVVGGLLGEIIGLDALFRRAGNLAARAFSRRETGGAANDAFARGFAEASILFCSGSMAIVGALQSGLEGRHETLFAKAVLDGAISVFLAASAGPGVALAAAPVFAYQGAVAALAGFLRDALTPAMIREMSAAGSLLVAAIGFNFIGVKEIKVANLIPAVFIPALYYAVKGLAAS